MEINNKRTKKQNKKNKVRRGPESEQKWGILKYLSAEISSEKSKTIQGQTAYECRILGQKLRFDNNMGGGI